MMKSQEQKMNHNTLKAPVLNTNEPRSTLTTACQTKSLQFRTIAPKAPAVLSCQSPSPLPEAPAVSPKSIIVPAQNFALMQVAGQEGTFSLVALSPSVSPQSAPPIQKGLTFPKNMKLPIPRYPPTRSKHTPEKSAPVQGVHGLTPTKTVMQPKAAVQTQSPNSSDTHCAVEGPEQVILIDSGSSEIAVTTLLSENAVLYSGAQVEKPVDPDKTRLDPATPSILQNLQFRASAPREPHTTTSLASSSSSTTNIENEGEKFRQCLSKPAGQSTSSIAVLSPAVFSKAVQIIPSPPKGKLPILPYSKMKNTYLPVAKLNVKSPEKSSPATRPGLGKATDLTPRTVVASDLFYQKQTPNCLQHNPPPANPSSLPTVGLDALQKPAGKKRGRKRKTIEDILAFEARKKRSLSFFRRRTPDKPNLVNNTSKDKVADISKKYRSIRPKPVLLMEAVPQLVGLPSLSAPECLEPEFLISRKTSECQKLDHTCGRVETPKAVGSSYMYLGNKQLHRCPTCSRCFQFKHHLQSHMNSHTNSRPYLCPMCRKTYAHSGSLSTHMKLHHTEGRPRKSLRCEFCEKAFGYVGVYFSHLKEVHKVILTVEPSVSHHEEDIAIEGEISPGATDDQGTDQEEPVELQIKCGRCQAITPTFADMKLHLLYVHGEEVQVRLKEGVLQGGREAEDELVKHAAHYWRTLNEKRNLVKCGSCQEEFFSFSKLKRHIDCHHQDEVEVAVECATDRPEPGSESTGSTEAHNSVAPRLGSAFNCLLCKGVLDSKDALFEHWREQHNCEEPAVLWTVVSSFMEREQINLSSENPEQ